MGRVRLRQQLVVMLLVLVAASLLIWRRMASSLQQRTQHDELNGDASFQGAGQQLQQDESFLDFASTPVVGPSGNREARFVTKWTHFYIALNLFNNAEVIPSLTVQLVDLIRRKLALAVGYANIFIAIFSNGSEDATTQLINNELVPALRSLGPIGIWAEANGTCCHGHHRKPKSMDRIHWMSCVRNAALRPLLKEGTRVFSNASYVNEDFSAPAEDVGELENDVLRALSNDPNADGETVRDLNVSGVNTEDPTDEMDVIDPEAIAVMFFNDIIFDVDEVFELVQTQQGNYDMACGMDYYYNFYDTWVTRDASGRAFSPQPPYAVDEPTIAAFKRGQPAQVKCCWNGLAIINAAIFLSPRLNLRFRANKTLTSCYASECQLMCEDMIFRGRDRIFINPAVKVAYEQKFYDMHHRPTLWSGLLLQLVWLFSSPTAAPPPDKVRMSVQGLQCVSPEEVIIKQWSLFDWRLAVVALALVACVVWWGLSGDRKGRVALSERASSGRRSSPQSRTKRSSSYA